MAKATNRDDLLQVQNRDIKSEVDRIVTLAEQLLGSGACVQDHRVLCNALSSRFAPLQFSVICPSEHLTRVDDLIICPDISSSTGVNEVYNERCLVFAIQKRTTIAQMFTYILGLPDDLNPFDLPNILKTNGLLLNREQLSSIIAQYGSKTDENNEVGLCTDGLANLVPLEDSDGSIALAIAYQHDDGWHEEKRPLDSDYVWGIRRRLIVIKNT